MKIKFNPSIMKTCFTHDRSDSKITVEKRGNEALITFSNGENNATLELENKEDFILLKKSMLELESALCSDRRPRGFYDEDTVVAINYENYGDPFEECIKFTFVIADAYTPWDNNEISSSLEINHKDDFLNAVSICFNR